MQTADERQEYQAPTLEVHGSIEAITQGMSTGNVLDASFPAGTPVTDITFS
jgi:hypothetical protein